jgi:hypothetical protein
MNYQTEKEIINFLKHLCSLNIPSVSYKAEILLSKIPNVTSNDLLFDLQPSYPVGYSPTKQNEEKKHNPYISYGIDNKLYDKLMFLSVNSKYSDILYPKIISGMYNLVYKDTSALFVITEQLIDKIITDYCKERNISNYLAKLSDYLNSDEVCQKLLLLRMNYTLNIGTKKVVSEIQIHRNVKGKLPFRESTSLIGDQEIYTGKYQSAFDIKDDELDRLANDFYSTKETISQTIVGTDEEMLSKINSLLNLKNYKISDNLDEVYNELNKLQKENIEESIIARIIYLIISSDYQKKLT